MVNICEYEVYLRGRPSLSLTIFSLLLCSFLGMGQDTCVSERFPPAEQFLVKGRDDVSYLQPNARYSVGHLVIVPEMRFDCHGHITGWSALTQLDSSDRQIDNLNHDITFQLWRPSPRGSSIYEVVWSKTLDFVNHTIRDGLVTEKETRFFNLTSILPNDERLYFQPGDVIGWYIHTLVQSIERPLTIVYRDLSNSRDPMGSSLQPVDMYAISITDVRRANTPPPCEVSLEACSENVTLYLSVVPYVSVHYGEYPQ